MQRLILFAKRPRRGRVKTRLVPPLRADQALAVYRAFLEDQIAFLASFPAQVGTEICVDERWSGPPAVPAGTAVTLQGPGDLGARLERAFRRAGSEGSTATVILGADSPTLPAALVREAFRRLGAGARAVLSPADDGGYTLVGLRDTVAALFREVPWGTPRVCDVSLERARGAGLTVERLAGWYDVDDAGGLRRLREELRQPAARARAPATARLLDGLDLPSASVL